MVVPNDLEYHVPEICFGNMPMLDFLYHVVQCSLMKPYDYRNMNVRLIPQYYADCPANFEELVDGNMGYEDQGGNYFVLREWVLLADIDPEFKNTKVYDYLYQLFVNHPDMYDVVLQPR